MRATGTPNTGGGATGTLDAGALDGVLGTIAMPEISAGAPAFASSSASYQSVASMASDN